MIKRLRELLALETGRQKQPVAVPDEKSCDPIPEEHRLVIALNGESPLSNVTIHGTFGENAFLTLDRRTPPGIAITVFAYAGPKPHDNISLTLGNVGKGRVNFVVTGSDIDVVVGNTINLHGKFGLGPESRVSVGENTTANGVEISCARGEVRIGRNCQIAGDVLVMGAAHHGVVDLSSGKPEIVTRRPDLRIGDHVWLGMRSYIGGNAQIGDGCIVAAHAVVVGQMPANCLIAGNPAKVRRKNIGWSRSPFNIDAGSKPYLEQPNSNAHI